MVDFLNGWVGAAAVVAALSLSGSAQADLITNGGAETGDLTGWTEIFSDGGDASVTSAAANVSSGNHAFHLVDNVGGQNTLYWRFRHDVDVDAATQYTLSFDYKAVDGFSRLFSLAEIFDGSQLGNFLDATAWTNAGGTAVAVSNGFTRYTITLDKVDFDWIEFRANSSTNTFEGYLDNVSLVPVPEPGSLGLTALGLVAVFSRRRVS